MDNNTQLTEEEAERRNADLVSLEAYISQSRNWLETCSTKIGFKDEKSHQGEHFEKCPVDNNHLMPKRSLEKHVKYCDGLKKGYTKDDMELILADTSFFYENHPYVVSVKIEDESFREIVKGKRMHYNYRDCAKEMPLTGERAQYELNREEKLALYEHVRKIARQKNPSNVISEEELLLLQDTKAGQKNPAKGKTYLERLAEERDFKRRRQSYRAKNVHVTRKSHTEIIREVIGNQMEILGQMWEDEAEEMKEHERKTPKIENQLDTNNQNDRSAQYKHRHRSRSPGHRRYLAGSHDRERGRGSPSDGRGSRKRDDRYDTRSPSKDRKISRSKKSKHSKRRSRSRSRSFDSKDGREGKSKHKHKKHKHKKDKKEKEDKYETRKSEELSK